MSTSEPGLDSAKEKNVADLLAKCEVSLHSKNFEDAISGCRAVLNISPDNPRAIELMEEAQSKLEAELFTRDNLKRAIEYFKMRDFQKCINECQKIQLLDPEHVEAAQLLSKAEQKQEAEPFVQNFITSGKSLFDSGLYGEAISQWEKVRSIDPEFPDLDRLINNAKHMMGEAGPSSGSASGGLFDLGEGASLDTSSEGFGFISDQDRIRQLLDDGTRLFNNEQYQSAIEVWSEIFMLDVSHPEALQKIESARNALNEQRVKLREIIKHAQEAYERGDVETAQKLFHDVKKIDPDNSEASKYLSLIEKPEHEPAGLEQLIQQGDEAEARGQYREAAQYLSQALAIDTENAALADRIKNLNLLAKKAEQGRALMGNARAFVAEGKFDSARHALSKILESDPSNPEALDLLRQVKESGAAAPTPAMAMPRVTVAKKSSVSPLILVVLIALAVGAGVYYFAFMQGGSEDTTPIQPAQVTKQPPAGTTGGTPTGANPGPGATPKESANEKVVRLVKEANFYLREKHFVEALKMAEEALALDPVNKDAIAVRLSAKKGMEDEAAGEQKLLTDANTYFSYSDYAGAVKLYKQYLDTHPDQVAAVQPQIIKCYYNLGILSIREWNCSLAADYFRQVLFIDERDQLSKEALALARRCQKSGSDLELRKAVALMEMRR